MKKALEAERQYILNYLKRDIGNCLYMYADIFKYGLDSNNVTVWYDTDNIGIRFVVMKYHNSFQIYSNREFSNIRNVLELVNEEHPSGIFGRKEIINELYKELNDQFEADFGVILKGKPIDLNRIRKQLECCDVKIELAKEDDALNIAELLYLDEELSSVYTKESLAEELRDRIRTKMGRSYIIRDENRIVAHNATYAESDKFVIISGFMVHPDFRNTEYAYWLDLKSSLEFQKEGKDRYFFALNDRIIRWHKIAKTPVVGKYGKLYLKDKE